MTTAAAPSATSAIVLRAAEPGDNEARCALFARVTMETELGLSVRRDPDFDALYRLQSPDWHAVVVELEGRVEGTGTILVRDGYVNGEPRRVGYLGDLRLSPAVQGRLLLDRAFAGLLAGARDRFGCELFLTSVIASNTRALRALVTRTARSRAAGRPVYSPAGDFDIRSLHLLVPRRSAGDGVPVRRAVDADIPALARLLDADARRRPFGYVFTEAEVRRRLAEWPGLEIGSFYVADAGSGDLRGCIALWDATPVKRMVVTAYRGGMRRVRFGYDLVARFLARAPLPRTGETFRSMYVTHQAIAGNDAGVLRALLEMAYRDAREADHHFLSVCVPHGSVLEPAFRGFHSTSLGARLFVVSLPEVDASPVLAPAAREWPGFEMALV